MTHNNNLPVTRKGGRHSVEVARVDGQAFFAVRIMIGTVDGKVQVMGFMRCVMRII